MKQRIGYYPDIDMSVTTETNRTAELVTDGIETDFDFDLVIHHKSWLQVWYQPTGGRYNSLLLDTNYSVIFTERGGTVSTDGYSAPLPAGKLLIIRKPPLTMQTGWLYNDNHTGQQHQDDFDHRSMGEIWLQEQIIRCPKFPIHSDTKDISFPEPQVGYLIGWNSAGDDLTNISPPAAAEDVPSVLNDLDDVTIDAPVNGDILRYNGTVWTNDLAGAVTFTSITIAGNTLDTNEWSNLDGLDQSLATGDNVVFNNITGAVITGASFATGTLTLADGSITDSGGTIDFDNELLTMLWLKTTVVKIRDANEADLCLEIVTENTGITANRVLTFDVGNVNRVLTLSGHPTLGDWFDQSVKTTASPVFDQVVIEDGAKTLIDVDGSNNLSIENLTGGANILLSTNAGGVVLTGTLTIPSTIIHAGDADTYISFTPDLIAFFAGNLEFLRFKEVLFGSDEGVFNEVGVDIDFRVEAVGQTHALFVQGSDGNVGIGDASPDNKLDVAGNIGIESNNELRFYDNGNYVGFEAPALSADQIWILPAADGNADEILTTNGSGVLSFTRMPKAIYAELSDSTDQAFAVAGTHYSITFNTNDEISGITHSVDTDTENITIVTTGVYTIFAQPQVAAAAGGAGAFHMWLQRNTGGGFADIANTNIELSLSSLEEDVIPLATTFALDSGDIIRLRVVVSDNKISLDAQAAVVGPPTEPAIPSIIFTMFMIGT